MKLYHGTSTKHIESIKNNGFVDGTWFALYDWHGWQLANRTAKRDGGEPIILEIEINCNNRIIGRNKPSFRYAGERYSIEKMITISRHDFI